MKSAIPFAFLAQPGASASRRDAEPQPVAPPRRRVRLLRTPVPARC
jgi:hypothetical protein